MLKRSNEKIRLSPQITKSNNDDYRYILSSFCNFSDGKPQPPSFKKRRIYRAYKYFQDRIDKMQNRNNNHIENVLAFLDKANSASLVKIEVESSSDAHTLFEALNNRGKPLTAIDIIKNKHLKKLDSKEPSNLKKNSDKWDSLLKNLGEDDYKAQERFLIQFYNAFRDELKAIGQTPMATRSNVIRIHEKLINNNAKEYFEKIDKAGRMYSLILTNNKDESLRKSETEKPIKDLERIKGAPSYSLILYLLVRQDVLELPDLSYANLPSKA